jgi:hypothetical protein
MLFAIPKKRPEHWLHFRFVELGVAREGVRAELLHYAPLLLAVLIPTIRIFSFSYLPNYV